MRNMLVPLGFAVAATLVIPAVLAQDAGKAGQKQLLDNTVKPCPVGGKTALLDDTVQPAGRAGGKVSVKDMTGPMSATAKTGSGGGTGKVNVQDLHLRTAAPGTATPAQNCAPSKP